MKFYFKLDKDNFIIDAITYQHEGYNTIYEADYLPSGAIGGWWKYENGSLIEYPELKPVNKDEEVELLKTKYNKLEQDNLTTLEACAELYETLLSLMPV